MMTGMSASREKPSTNLFWGIEIAMNGAVYGCCWKLIEPSLTVTVAANTGFRCQLRRLTNRPERAQKRRRTMATQNTNPTKKAQTKTQALGEQFKEWRSVATATAANAAELPPTAVQLTALNGVLGEVDKILADQAVFRANKQMASKRLKTLVNQGAKLATVLKVIAKQHYGNGNDKLVEFGIQPLRSRPKPTVVPPTAPPPEAGTPAPTTTPLSSK